MKRNLTVINDFKEYDIENLSEIESDSNEDVLNIGNYLRQQFYTQEKLSISYNSLDNL